MNIRPSVYNLGQVQTKVEMKNERDDFSVFLWNRVGEMARVIQKMTALTDKNQGVGGSARQELHDIRKISWGFEDEKDLKDDLEWQEKKSELT